MDWIILIAITLLSAVGGYRKGALRMTLRIMSFVAGYIIAWKFTPTLAQWFIDSHKLQGIIVYPAAGLSLFLGTGIALNVICSILLWLIPARIKNGGKSVGAALGGLFGLFFSILCIWSVGIAQQAFTQKQHANDSHTTATQITSPLQKIAGKVINTATQITIGSDNPAASITSQILSDPTSVSQELNYLSKQPDIRELFSDADNYRAMVNGTPEQIMQLPSFQNLISDQQAMAFLSQAGLVGNTVEEKQQTLADHFSTYAKNMELIKNTPEYRNIITDPNIMAQLRERNYVALLTNEKVRLLTEMLISGPRAINTHSTSKNTSNSTVNKPLSDVKPKQTIYRWKDKNGGTHYTADMPSLNNVDGEVVEVKH